MKSSLELNQGSLGLPDLGCVVLQKPMPSLALSSMLLPVLLIANIFIIDAAESWAVGGGRRNNVVDVQE